MEQAYREDLAYIHDAGFGRFAQGAAGVLLDELTRRGVGRGLVIDLGCGSGILAEQMARPGYEVLGIDLSEALLALARQRLPGGVFRQGSVLDAELPRCVAVALVGEVISYLFDEKHSWERVRRLLTRIFEALLPGGLLLMDVVESGRVPGGTMKSFWETSEWAVLVAAEESADLLTRHITSFRKVGDHYRRDHEVHRQRLLPRALVISWLQQIGFEVETLAAYGAVPFGPGHVGFLSRKA